MQRNRQSGAEVKACIGVAVAYWNLRTRSDVLQVKCSREQARATSGVIADLNTNTSTPGRQQDKELHKK